MDEIKEELKYHRKLLEDIVNRLDEIQSQGQRSRNNANAAMEMLMNNPMLKANPTMAEALGAAFRNVGMGAKK